MLDELERKLTATIADGLATRPHLQVVQAPDPGLPAAAGQGRLRVAVAELTPRTGFAPAAFARAGTDDAPRSRRVLPLSFTARLTFRHQPAGVAPADLTAGRETLLEDVSLVGHLLDAETVRGGQAFAIESLDPGFRVRAFLFAGGALDETVANGFLGGELRYAGEAEIWPPGILAEEHPIRIDLALQTQPITIVPDTPALLPGATTPVRVRAAPGRRLLADLSGDEPLALAITVLGDRPPAERGTIATGTEGAATGFRIVPVTPGETLVTYQAPATGPGGELFEYVTVHLATPARLPGLFLGSAPVRLLPGGA